MDCLLRLGDSLREVTSPLLSPTMMTGCEGLKLMWLRRDILRETTDWAQTGWYRSKWISYTTTFPSLVTAANVVLKLSTIEDTVKI